MNADNLINKIGNLPTIEEGDNQAKTNLAYVGPIVEVILELEKKINDLTEKIQEQKVEKRALLTLDEISELKGIFSK